MNNQTLVDLSRSATVGVKNTMLDDLWVEMYRRWQSSSTYKVEEAAKRERSVCFTATVPSDPFGDIDFRVKVGHVEGLELIRRYNIASHPAGQTL